MDRMNKIFLFKQTLVKIFRNLHWTLIHIQNDPKIASSYIKFNGNLPFKIKDHQGVPLRHFKVDPVLKIDATLDSSLVQCPLSNFNFIRFKPGILLSMSME